jgi:hypothetical protein
VERRVATRDGVYDLRVLGPVDPIRLTQVVAEAGKWLHEVATKGAKEREQRAASILKEAGVLSFAIQNLQNETQALISAISRFDEEWTMEQRAELYDRIADFMGQRRTIPVIERSVAELQGSSYRVDVDIALGLERPLRELIECGEALVDLDYSGKRAFMVGLGELSNFWYQLKIARDMTDIPSLHRWVMGIDQPALFDPLSRAAQEFGKIKAAVLSDFPGLPYPSWAEAA